MRVMLSTQILLIEDDEAIDNPGPGGFRSTTNNCMELWACIEGLKALKQPCEVALYSDPKYVVNGITRAGPESGRPTAGN
jgi:ribonuclease HI